MNSTTAIYKYISTSTFILTVNIQQTYMLRNMISTCIHLSDTTSCTRKSCEIIRMKMKSTRLHALEHDIFGTFKF